MNFVCTFAGFSVICLQNMLGKGIAVILVDCFFTGRVTGLKCVESKLTPACYQPILFNKDVKDVRGWGTFCFIFLNAERNLLYNHKRNCRNQKEEYSIHSDSNKIIFFLIFKDMHRIFALTV